MYVNDDKILVMKSVICYKGVREHCNRNSGAHVQSGWSTLACMSVVLLPIALNFLYPYSVQFPIYTSLRKVYRMLVL